MAAVTHTTTSQSDTIENIRVKITSGRIISLLAVTAVAFSAAYWPVFVFWWSRWVEKDSYYSHAPFVPIASAFIIWFNRKRIAKTSVKPSGWGFVIMAFAGVAGWFSWMGASASVMGFTVPVFLSGFIIAVFGFAVMRELMFPVLLLYFASVLPESLLTALSFKAQMLSVKIATGALNLIGVNAANRGAYIDLPNLTVEVGSACSGFRLVISMLAIAAFFSYIRRGPRWGKITLFAFALPLSLIINSSRVTLIALSGHFWGGQILVKVHDWTGYAVLLVCAGVLLLFARIVGCARYKEMPL